jgi:hypothetical protein
MGSLGMLYAAKYQDDIHLLQTTTNIILQRVSRDSSNVVKLIGLLKMQMTLMLTSWTLGERRFSCVGEGYG